MNKKRPVYVQFSVKEMHIFLYILKKFMNKALLRFQSGGILYKIALVLKITHQKCNFHAFCVRLADYIVKLLFLYWKDAYTDLNLAKTMGKPCLTNKGKRWLGKIFVRDSK